MLGFNISFEYLENSSWLLNQSSPKSFSLRLLNIDLIILIGSSPANIQTIRTAGTWDIKVFALLHAVTHLSVQANLFQWVKGAEFYTHILYLKRKMQMKEGYL